MPFDENAFRDSVAGMGLRGIRMAIDAEYHRLSLDVQFAELRVADERINARCTGDTAGLAAAQAALEAAQRERWRLDAVVQSL